MKQINLNCFQSANTCQISSADHQLLISNPLDQEMILEIFNQASQACYLNFRLEAVDDHFDLKTISVMISDEEQLFYKGNLEFLLSQSVVLDFIEAHAFHRYYFSLDLLQMLTVIEDKPWLFNIFLDFDCPEELTKQNFEQDQVFATAEQKDLTLPSQAESSRAAVLALTDQSLVAARSSQAWQALPLVILCLFGLFMFIFFVIMKFVHGKKKQKTKKINF